MQGQKLIMHPAKDHLDSINRHYNSSQNGNSLPRFSTKPLWVRGVSRVRVDPHATLTVPEGFIQNGGGWHEDHIQLFCQKMKELGYDMAILGSFPGDPLSESMPTIGSLSKLQALFSKSAIDLCISFDNIDIKSRGELKTLVEELFDPSLKTPYLFLQLHQIEGLVSKNDILTDEELLIENLKAAEEALRGRASLIFYMPYLSNVPKERQLSRLQGLLDHAGCQTTIAFPSVAGPVTEDWLNLHPLWNYLSERKFKIETPLMPLMNIGSIHSGEGFWPTLPFERCDRLLNAMKRHAFKGAAALTPRLPGGRGMLACSLSVFATLASSEKSFYVCALEWGKANRPDWQFEENLESLLDLNRIAMELQKLKQSESLVIIRARAEAIFYRLDLLSETLGKSKGLSSYVEFFIQDARRIALYWMQEKELSQARSYVGGLGQESFWTKLAPASGLDKVKISFYDKPFVNSKNETMMQVFRENNLF